MFNDKLKSDLKKAKDIALNLESDFDAIKSSVGFVELSADGYLIFASDIFLGWLGYSLNEVKGQHHKILCSDKHVRSEDYQHFWTKLRQGDSFSGTIERIAKNGESVWLKATYIPVKNSSGKTHKIIKVAENITELLTKFFR